MKRLFEEFTLGNVRLKNRFLFPPIKLGYGKKYAGRGKHRGLDDDSQ